MKWIDFERKIKAKNIKLFTPLDVQKFLGRTKIATRFFPECNSIGRNRVNRGTE